MYEKIIERMINESVKIGKDDAVLIHAWEHTLDFASKLSLECMKKGADALIYVETDALFSGRMRELSDELIKDTFPKLEYALVDPQTVEFNIGGPKDPAIFEDMPLERLPLLGEGRRPVEDKFRDQKIPYVSCALGLVTPERAKSYGVDYDAWLAEMTAALDVSYSDIKEFGKKIADRVETAQKVQITAPGGTEVTLSLAGRSAYINDGVIDAEDLEKGANTTGLPAGQINVAPLETSAAGRVVANLNEAIGGTWMTGLEWTFEEGRATTITGKENLELWKKIYDRGTGAKDRVGALSFGLNPKAETGFLHNGIVKGVVGISIGGNKYLGGENEATGGGTIYLANATVKLDGETLLENGRFAL
ncbi:MAG: aminopeptidase [Candidatus Hodarchaeales archaeon]